MTRVLIAGFQHETNTFAPSLADWSAFTRGDSFPPFMRGVQMQMRLSGINIPIAGFIGEARLHDWQLLPSAWAGAIPSSCITSDAFDRITSAIVEDAADAIAHGGLDAIYLDLHGAAVAQQADDAEGELLARLRAVVGPSLPIVASLDLHANVTERMLRLADGLVAYRSYPHVDMAETGARAAQLLARRFVADAREPLAARRLPFLIPINAQSTWMQPAKALYQTLSALDAEHGTVSSFCMGFPASDFAECAPMVWSHGAHAAAAADALYAAASDPAPWRGDERPAAECVARALDLAEAAALPVVIADTQDNPGAGGDSNTTGVLHALLQQGAGRRYPGQVALGLLYDPTAAQAAHAAGIGSDIEIELGSAVRTFSGGLSDPPVAGRFTVRALADGHWTLTGPMMTGVSVQLGLSACLEIDGVLVAVVSGKKQLLDRGLMRMVGIEHEQMRIVVVKSSNHFRADYTEHASHVLVAKALGPMAADPAELPWVKLPDHIRRRP